MAPTNLTLEDMLPDTVNPAHDSRYWCLPPVRDHVANPQKGGKYPMYLVTQGRVCGIFKSWLLTKAMVDGYPAGAQRGHKSAEACVDEWQLQCRLGLHPHPVDPAFLIPASGFSPPARPPASPSPPPSPPSSPPPALSGPVGSVPFSPSRERARRVNADLQQDLLKYCRLHVPKLESDAASISSASTLSASSAASVNSSNWDATPQDARHYAIWGIGVVYSDVLHAKSVFKVLEAAGKKPQVLSTENYDEAQAFSEGVYWLPD